MNFINKGYSYLIRPLFLVIDLLVINAVVYFISDNEYLNIRFLLYINLLWVILAYYVGFYKIYRFTNFFRIVSLLAIQFLFFFLIFFAYFGIFKEGQVVNNQFLVFTSIFIGVSLLKFSSLYALKWYRSQGKNYRNVIVLGYDDTAKKIIKMFSEKSNLGYRYFGFFCNKKSKNTNYLGVIDECRNYILQKEIDEIYCSLSVLTKAEVKELTKFTNQHSLTIKLIPEANELYSKNFTVEYFENTLVLNVRKLPFEYPENIATKRLFDIVFSTFVIIFLMSWVTPIIWIFIKLESKGPLFFKQQREGLAGEKFVCYKFRSMRLNKLSDQVHAKKGDNRITTIGSFLRKTSLDELPQFFNVLKGDMSIVGPRPHMESLSIEYQKQIDNYMERHTIKPGITGLAQVSGYRGEVKERADIKNRVRMDIFYIENWSFLLDIKIIIQTVLNVFKGEEKAY